MFASRFRCFGSSCGHFARVLSVCIAILLNVWMGWNAYQGYQKLSDETNIAKLNQKVSIYKQKVGTLPDLNLIDLYHEGLTQQRLHRTPFGGYYRLNPNLQAVYNPNIASR
jgi:hypothetical protein